MSKLPVGMIEVQFKREVSNARHDRMQLAQVFAPNGMLARTYCYNNAGVLEGNKSYHFDTNKKTIVKCSVGSPKNPNVAAMLAPTYLLKISSLAKFHLPMPASIPCKV